MEVFGNLAGGFATALQPVNVAFLFLGVALGLVIGVLPGLGGTSGVAILLPVTVFIPPTSAVIFLAGIYWGALIATVLFTFFAIPLADWALAFGPPELFAVYLLAFATLTGLESGSPIKSLSMIGFGLLLAAIGFDTVTGRPRLTFGRSE